MEYQADCPIHFVQYACFFWRHLIILWSFFYHILKRQLSCKPTPCCLHGVWSHTSRPAGAVFSAPHCVSTGQVQTFQFSQTESWVQTWAMPLFHILTTAQHEPVRPKYDPTCYNVHHEVCAPNIERCVQVSAWWVTSDWLHSSGWDVGGAVWATTPQTAVWRLPLLAKLD